MRLWAIRNRERWLAQKKAWAKTNPERVRELARRSTAKHPDRTRQRKWEWEQRNKAVILVRERARRRERGDELRAYFRAYVKAHLDKARTNCIRRRATQAGAEGHHTTAEWHALLASYHGLCVYCGGPARSRDHIVPLARGGSNWIENIVPACLSCNRDKHARPLLAWLVKRAA